MNSKVNGTRIWCPTRLSSLQKKTSLNPSIFTSTYLIFATFANFDKIEKLNGREKIKMLYIHREKRKLAEINGCENLNVTNSRKLMDAKIIGFKVLSFYRVKKKNPAPKLIILKISLKVNAHQFGYPRVKITFRLRLYM